MGKLIPILLALIGLAGGGAAGYFLRPPPEEVLAENPCGNVAPASESHGEEAVPEGETSVEYVKLNNQFVVPVVEQGQIVSLVILSLSLEVRIGGTEKVYAVEPKLRDSLLQVLFDYANSGGFRGSFTETATLGELRRSLLEAGRQVLGDQISAVLISDIVRQDTN